MAMDRLYENAETRCCPRFNPEPWDGKEITFEEKLFVKDRIRSFLHIPLDFGRVMVRNMERIQAAAALSPEPLMLCDENSLWGSDVYIAVTKDVPGAEMVRLSFLEEEVAAAAPGEKKSEPAAPEPDKK